MVYRIAVLDDDAAQLHRTADLFSRYRQRHPEYELDITCYSEMTSFMNAVCSGAENKKWAFEILLMDIHLPDGNGIKGAEVLREKGFEGVIIFQSSSPEHGVDAFSVRAMRYLVKPVGQEKMDEAIDRAVAALEKRRRYDAMPVQKEIDGQPGRKQTAGPAWRHFVNWMREKWS